GLAAGDCRVVEVWNVEAASAPVALCGHTVVPVALCFSRDGRRLASAAWTPPAPAHEIKVWDVVAGRPLAEWTGNGRGWSLDFSPAGRLLATAGPGRSVTVVDWQTRQTVLDVAGDGEATAVVFRPDGKQLASAELGGEVVNVWEVPGDEARAAGQPRHAM